jgi:1-acyl-sn-glycerol-3-phosphate acyltransferase
MLLTRSIFFFALMIATTVVIATPLVILTPLLPFTARSHIAGFWARVILWFLDLTCNLNHQIKGWENLPDGSAIIMAKHQSAWETLAMRGLFPQKQAWIFKRELLWIPFLGWALAAVGSISINRSSGRAAMRQVISKGTEKLKMGRLVMIFPEGTRVAPGERKRYGMGGAILAEKSEFPIIPVAHNAGVFWRRRGVKKYPGTVQMVIGEPIDPKGKSANEIIAEVEEWIETTVAKLPQ